MKPLAALLLSLVAAPALAGKVEAVAPSNVGAVSSLEEVVIQGDRTLSAARKAMVDAEDRFYARWNDLNDDRKFDIRCHNEIPSDHPSRIWHRVCQPAFLEDMVQVASAEFVQAMQGGTTAGRGQVMLPSSNPGQVMLMRAEMKKRTLAMLQKDPELMRALLERARLEQHFEALRKEKFKDRWIVWD